MTDTGTISNTRQHALIAYEVTVDGEPVIRNIESISIYFEVNGIPGARIVLTDGDVSSSNFELSSQQRFYPGKKVEIKAGYKHADTLLFKGMIMRHTIRNRNYVNKTLRGSNLVLECRHELVKASLANVNKIFHHVSDSEVLSQLLKKYVSPVTVDPLDFNFPELVQYQQSDWAFMVQRAVANGFVIMPACEKVLVGALNVDQEPELTLRYGKNLLDLDAELDSQHQAGQVTFYSWDPASQEVVTASDKLPSGASEITEATGYNQSDVFHTGAIPDEVMQAVADGQKHIRNLSQKRGRVRCSGTGVVHIGDMISLKGTGTTFDGNVLVTGVRHSITSGEWYTDIQFGLSAEAHKLTGDLAEQRSNHGGLLIGIVLQIENDPQSNERVLVSIPMLNDREGIWARLSAPDAGEERGWICRPEVDDEVIIGFLQNDPNHPVILGRLHSAKHPAPYPAENKNPLKGFKSRSGLELLFDDTEKSISLKTEKNNILKLSDTDEGIKLTDQHDNNIVLHKDGIALTSGKDLVIKARGEVKISGNKIDIQATTEVDVKAKTGLSLSTNAIATLKGNLVKIN